MLLNKVLITGEASVGKTSIASLINDMPFPESHIPTNLASFFQFQFSDEERTITINVWDVGGTPVLTFDLTQLHTFQRLYDIAPAIAQLSQNTRPFFILVGNKSDLSDEIQVTEEQINSLKTELCCNYFQVSAKDKLNIDSLKNAIGETCIAKLNGTLAPIIKLKPQTDDTTCCLIC